MIYMFISVLFICHARCNDFSEKASSDLLHSQDNSFEDESNACKNLQRNCSNLDYICMNCSNYTPDCIYGDDYNITCKVHDDSKCLGERTFQKTARCQYCYQTENWEHTCEPKNHCISVASPPQYYKTNCTVHDDVICLGNRTFLKKLRCNWTRGHKWSTALILSITLGGFGADRFYLGHWQEGIGKLFSFGGLGVWTLVDVLLIAIRYLGPADGSFYV
ncbi:TM2 domain-containing protein almondex [Planococcus citri]|uniref:TM2 domain-containing protein almondex n=1 Tax=Planococcus citri TaxID=170843 RepID=UPI0031F89E72